MRFIYFIIIVVATTILQIVCHQNTHAQDFWEDMPFPDTALINCIATNNEGHIFLGARGITATGGVYRSTDGGYTWDFVFDNGDHTVYAIACTELGNIYIGKRLQPRFMISEDNGDSWQGKGFPTYSNMMKILPVGEDTVYASPWEDQGAILLRSPDHGDTWDTVFRNTDFDVYVSDVVISDSGTIYISLFTHSEDAGGVYSSDDGGSNWEFLGLLNHQVSSLSFNSNNDLFAGSQGGWVPPATSGLFVLRHGNDQWEGLVYSRVTDLVINSEDHIYCTNYSASTNIIRSTDDGESFEVINSGISTGVMNKIISDTNDYLYVINAVTLGKSINTTVQVYEPKIEKIDLPITIFPNPVTNSQFLTVMIQNQTAKIDSIKVYSMKGEIVPINYYHSNSNTISVDVSSLPAGIYLIEMMYGDKILTTKFLKL